MVSVPSLLLIIKTNIDWAGLVLERVTKMTLNDYMQEHICKPLGLTNVNMFPTEDMKRHLAFMNQRRPDGKLAPRDHLLRRPLTAERTGVLNSGGAGMYAKPQEYARTNTS